MKKIIPIALSLLTMFIADKASAQSFSIDKDTVHYVVYGNAEPKARVTNLTSSSLDLDWKITSHNFSNDLLDAGFGVCDVNTCYNYDATSNMNENRDDCVIPANGFMDMKMVLTIDNVPGSGTPWYLTVNVVDSATMYSKNLTFAITKWSTNVPSVSKGINNINMYPNPASNELNVIFEPAMGVKNITVYNLIGKAVTVYKTTSNSSAKLNIENLPTGVYFIRLSDNQGRVVANRKFTKQ